MNPSRLWAKSKRDNEQEQDSMFLRGHLEDVYIAAQHVLDATGEDQLWALGLPPDKYRNRFRRIVLLAAAVHDLGKANDHFQDMITGHRIVRVNPQGVRHEWVSLLLLRELREWLLPAVGGDARDITIVEWAVSGHHPAHDHSSPPRTCPPGAGADIDFQTDHADFGPILVWLRDILGLGPVPALGVKKRTLVNAHNVFLELAEWSKAAGREWETKWKRTPEARLVAAAKNCLIAADVAGSALPKKLPNNSARWGWIEQSFDCRPKRGELQQIVDHRLKGGSPREFQRAVADSSCAVTFVKAGCGSGKTLSAYMWAAKNHPTRRLYFCYPTTGTATEGFKDYLHEPDVKADLFHSRRDVDLEIILTTGPDEKNAAADAAIRIESLDAWSTPIVACTVDTVLGLVQNNKRGLFAWPALSQSAFVFDEIHAYDDRLFGALLRFLRDLPGLPSLLMTASLPEPREEALRTTLEQFRRIELAPIPGPVELEELPRYHKAVAQANDPLPLVRETHDAGGKVLWVCNTVKRVMDAAERAKAIGLKPLIYHSRFKYIDRVQRHKDVIDAFDPKTNSGPALAICSQVAEMSLDLSADLLVTDLATVPAIIQRLGRLNRRAKTGDATKPFVLVEPEAFLPYTESDLQAARVWLAKLPETHISQKHLADSWEQIAENQPEPVPSAWLDGGPTTTVAELRETSPGITVLMIEDHQAVIDRPKSIRRYTLPMPPPPGFMDWRAWQKYGGIPVAEQGTITYDKKRGAEWRK